MCRQQSKVKGYGSSKELHKGKNCCKYYPAGVEIFSVNLLCPCAVASYSTFAHEKVKAEWNNQGGKLSKRQVILDSKVQVRVRILLGGGNNTRKVCITVSLY